MISKPGSLYRHAEAVFRPIQADSAPAATIAPAKREKAPSTPRKARAMPLRATPAETITAPIPADEPTAPAAPIETAPPVTSKHHIPDNSIARRNPAGEGIAYVYQKPYVTASGREGVRFYAKCYRSMTAKKSDNHHVYATEAEMESAIAQYFASL